MKIIAGPLAAGALAAVLTVAVSQAVERLPAGLPASAALLLRYDADHDGNITKAEMEAGLKLDFAAADSNHNDCLDPGEVRAENERRVARDGRQGPPPGALDPQGCGGA